MWWLQNPFKNPNIIEEKYEIYYEWQNELNSFLESHPATSPYHLKKWQHLVQETFKHKHYNIVLKKENEIKAFLPLTLINSLFFGKYFVSIGFADTCGLLAENLSSANYLINSLNECLFSSKAKYIEIRNSKEIKSDFFMTKKDKVLSYLYLPENERILWQKFDPKLRNQIRKALKSNIDVVFGGENIIRDFYKVYSRNMRDLGSPQLPFLFFKNLINIYREDSEVVVMYKNQIPIGGAVGIYYKNTMEVPWASSRRDYFKYCPNNLLYWEILKRCIEKGIIVFSFGRSSINSSTYNFKKQWGTIDQLLNYVVFCSNIKNISNLSPNNPKYKLAIMIWKKLPIFFTSIIGPFIAKNIA